ncbi:MULTISPECIES: MarR family winged helix-turn-helix transcriptional regulator [Paracoccaceae]|jgi:DNA-binding MarR family transcriptional regulator|uniref:MarR family winged helix-turn-helix transcriptional regulator n=1 Tax=Rhodobacterales TaxID=204455 RepID=UPI001AFEE916|nr:MarR family transcriptional regulator [Boseongicola sp. H5]MBO6602760.1 MarR family transcriptional regulator [Roseicyclus sp.]MBO6623991.1 MarR family transcriptional regulator [Roseicyclus sp.]MBO6923000.1 MarR family transcriptional regulator [Roseicyclus sp.]
MASKKDGPPKSIGRSLNFTAGRMNALCQQLLDPYDLSLPQWVVLSCLWRSDGLTVGALAELVGTGLPATSRIVDRMIDRGLVRRRRHASDGRVMVVTLTEKGRDLDHLSDFHERINTVLLEGFSPSERELAFSFLLRMQTNAETALGER